MGPIRHEQPMFEDMYGNRYEDYRFDGTRWWVTRDNGEVIVVNGEDENPLGTVGDWLEGI